MPTDPGFSWPEREAIRKQGKKVEGTLWRLDEIPLWTQIGLFVYTDICTYTHTNTNVCVYVGFYIHISPALSAERLERETPQVQ